jgi:hypothetical protein
MITLRFVLFCFVLLRGHAVLPYDSCYNAEKEVQKEEE